MQHVSALIVFIGVAIQGIIIWRQVCLRRELGALLKDVTERNEQSRMWLAHANALIQFARYQLALHGIEMPEPPEETVQ